jgi:hypothetical protein
MHLRSLPRVIEVTMGHLEIKQSARCNASRKIANTTSIVTHNDSIACG